MTSERSIFINLSVRDLPKSMEFFRGLGFSFEPKFTNQQGACMIVNGSAFVMLLAESFFSGFTDRQICDRDTHTETLLALSCASRAEVNQLVEKALASGGLRAKEPVDHGFMYGWSFYDPDGHHWELVWMDPNFNPNG